MQRIYKHPIRQSKPWAAPGGAAARRLWALGVCLALTAVAAVDGREPNILLIVADDLGYADVGFNGCRDIATPHLDALASRGVRCTSGYVTFPVCSPSRAGLMTGRHQARFGHETNIDWAPDDDTIGLPLDQVLISEVLQQAGYRTGCIGKWHLGMHPVFHPNRRGFDEFFGMLHGGHMYLPTEPIAHRHYTHPLDRNGEPELLQEHLTELLAREAAEFIETHRGERWFLYLSFNAPHTPLQSTPELIERASHISDPTRRMYAALVLGLDDAIGVVLDELQSSGQAADTLVFFFSDNGGAPVASSDNSPLRGAKGSLYEGGIRVPFVVSWPGRLPAGTDYEQPVSALDVFATSVAVSGASVAEGVELEGADLVAYLSEDKTGSPHEYLFWRKLGGERFAVRHGDWKLVQDESGSPQLYNLGQDVSEAHDLAASNAEVVQQLAEAYRQWDEENVEPLPLRKEIAAGADSRGRRRQN